jgi:hypothetical protein
MTTCTLACKNDALNVHSKLSFRLSRHPHISLVTVINWIWVRVFRRNAVVNAENRYVKFFCPPSSVALHARGRTANHATPMKVNNRRIYRLRSFSGLILEVKFDLKGTQ